MKRNLNLIVTSAGFLLSTLLFSTTRHIGTGQTYATLTQATAVAVPGDTLMVHAGTYAGGLSISNLQGTPSQWIRIFTATAEVVIYNGGGNAWQISDAAYVHIKGFIFQQQTGNGFNMDDGGSYATPSHHVLFESCTFRDINATGNNDLLKMSGVDNFEIRNCTFLNGSAGGSGIDMVGCHDGLITGTRFENQGSNSIQAKGGCKNVRIEANFFKNGGQRSVNLGGSTGLQFFRPINAKYEAAELKVYSNVFIGSDAPIAYVGCINTEVVNNTIYMPKKWVIRILQETVDTSRFYPCGNNTFRNNIVYHDNQVTTDCNIGPDTDPASFTFSNDLWFHSQNPGWAGPNLPVQDVNRIVGQNPVFVNAVSENFALQTVSPAIAQGYAVAQPVKDYAGNNFNSPRSIGAFEGNVSTGFKEHNNLISENKIIVYPNPSADGEFSVVGFQLPVEIKIYNAVLETVYNQQLTTDNFKLYLPAGVYFLEVMTGKERYVQKLINQ